ncbi:hypothetical protein B0H13DRAFT_1890620 [Mycena leptocephala]|nr:hypothetical protein B0H13DRAFT_1890620 [Mycena leptocephala]
MTIERDSNIPPGSPSWTVTGIGSKKSSPLAIQLYYNQDLLIQLSLVITDTKTGAIRIVGPIGGENGTAEGKFWSVSDPMCLAGFHTPGSTQAMSTNPRWPPFSWNLWPLHHQIRNVPIWVCFEYNSEWTSAARIWRIELLFNGWQVGLKTTQQEVYDGRDLEILQFAFETWVRYQYQEFRKKPSDTAVSPIHNHLVPLRHLAISAPPEPGTRFIVDSQIRRQNPHPGARQVPKTFTTNCSRSDTVELHLSTALQSGLDGFSLVWTATVVGVPQTCLVNLKKIIQASLCPLPDPSNLHRREAYYDPLDLVHNEAWGLSILYLSGLFDVSRPLRDHWTVQTITLSREAAWGLILESIPGLTIHDVTKSMSTATVHDFCTLGLDAVRDLALSGWILRDIRGANFILTGSPGSQAVVMIDLYDTEHIRPPSPERLAIVDTKRFFDTFQSCVSDDYPGIHDWARQHLPLIVWDNDCDPSLPDSEENM